MKAGFFIDLYWLLRQYRLEELFAALKQKYTGVDYNEPHLLKSLVYFVNADGQPTPRLHKEIAWEEIKKELVNKVKAVKI